ncbi:MAG: AraC family transcriptional regulator [Lentisphaeria bacterium]
MPTNPLLHLEDVFHRYAQRCPVPALYSWREEYASDHVHDFFELRICAEGALDVLTRNGRYRLEAGDAVLLRPGTPHVCGNARLHTGYIIGLTPDLLHQELAWTLQDPMLSRLLWSGPQQAGKNTVVAHLPQDELQRVQESIKVLLHNSWLAHAAAFEPTLRSEQIGHLTLVLSRLSRALAAAANETPGTGPGRVHPSLIAALRLMEKDPAHDWSLAELTRKLGLERSYLLKLFHQTLGLPPMQYLFRSRLELAARLLTGSDLPAGEVAGKVGWLNQTLFCRHFRKRFDMSPLQYRQRFRYRAATAHDTDLPPHAAASQLSGPDRILLLEPVPLPPPSTTGDARKRNAVPPVLTDDFQLVAMGRQQLAAGEHWDTFPAGCHGIVMMDFGQLTATSGNRPKTEFHAWQATFCHPATSPAWRATQDSALRWIAWRGRQADTLAAAGLMDQVPPYLALYAANRVMDAWLKLVRLLERTDPAVAVERQAILLEMLSSLACPEGAPSHYAISG